MSESLLPPIAAEHFPRLGELELAAALDACKSAGAVNAGVAIGRHILRVEMEETSLRTENARLREERDAWKKEWRAALDRIGGKTNEQAARRVAEQMLQTLSSWRRAREPGPFIVDSSMDGESFVVAIKNAISARTDELESQLTTLRTLVGELSRTAERIKVKLEDALPYIGNPANPSHIPRAAINEAIDQLTAVLAKADKIGGANEQAK
jgi:hypothetical protein